MTTWNEQIVLTRRPKGPVTPDIFETKQAPLPEVPEGHVLVRNEYLSIDPTIRGWLERDTYLPAIPIGEVVRAGGAGEVVTSRRSGIEAGQKVFGLVGWQKYSLHGPDQPLNVVPPNIPLDKMLGVLGLNGLTAYFGLLDLGKPQPGDTVVVSGAAGATGSAAGQIAKIKGCHVVGIAGSDAKCRWLTEELGFDGAINYKHDDVDARLAETCPEGINVFFDNVGGPILDSALAKIAHGARVVICGAISQYNNFEDVYGPKNYMNLLMRRARMEGFIVLDYAPRFQEATVQLAQWVEADQLKHRVTVVDGLENCVATFNRLFSGEHDGKLLVRL